MNTSKNFNKVVDILAKIEDVVGFDKLVSLYDTYYIDFENAKIYCNDTESWTTAGDLADALYYLLRDDFKNVFINAQLNYLRKDLLNELKELS